MERYAASLGLLFELLEHTTRMARLLRDANAEGRELSDEEWEEILGDNRDARERLADAIELAESREDPE